MCDVVADKLQCGTFWKTLARDLKPKIPDHVIVNLEKEEETAKERCRMALQKWKQTHTSSATNKELLRCLTNMGLARVNWHIMKQLGLVESKDIPESER